MASTNGLQGQSPVIFTPLQFLTDSPGKYAVILLNGPFTMDHSLFEHVWNHAAFRSVADGGANSLKTRFFATSASQIKLPDLISGDMDSARREHLDFFSKLGVRVVSTPDQNQTDFTKNLRLVKQVLRDSLMHEPVDTTQTYSIVVLNAHGGRFDHEFANINTLFISELDDDKFVAKANGNGVRFRVTLFSGDTYSCLLRSGQYVLRLTGLETDWCALIPFNCERAVVTTQGLRWDVTNREMSFGDCVSTSNAYQQSVEQVSVDTSAPLLYCCAVHYKAR